VSPTSRNPRNRSAASSSSIVLQPRGQLDLAQEPLGAELALDRVAIRQAALELLT